MTATQVFRSNALEVVVLPESGARVHSIVAFGHPVTHTPTDVGQHRHAPFHWGGYHMVPWCNRLVPGPVEVLGRTVDLPPNFADGTAIHGLHVLTEWHADGDAGTLVARHHADDRWPWAYTAAVTYRVEGPAFTVAYEVRNDDAAPMPAGAGFHPWFRVPSRMRIPSATVFTDNTATPAEPEPVRGPYDLREPAAIQPGVDACWPGLERPAIEVWWDELGVRLDYSARRPDGAPVIAVAAHIADVGAAAIELQTHAPQGIRRLLGREPWPLDVVAPGRSLQLELTLTFARF